MQLSKGSPGRTSASLCALAAALAAIAYANAIGGAFVFDDRLEILNNQSIERPTDFLGLLQANVTRPVVNVSYAVDYAIWGGRDPRGFHLTNIVLHVLNVALLFGLVLNLGRDRDDLEARPRLRSVATLSAFVAAALLAVHPLMTEAVSYVSSRSEVLATTFFLAAFLSFRRRLARGGAPWLLGGLVSFGLLLGTRETVVVLPVILLVYDRLLLPNGFARSIRFTQVHVPLIVAVVLLGLIRVWVYVTIEYGHAAGLQPQHIWLVAQAFGRYVSLLMLPIEQSIVHGVHPTIAFWDIRVAGSVAMFLLLVVIAFRARARHPLMTLGIVWFVLALIPSSLLVLLTDRGQPLAEHRMYLASCGFFLAAGSLVGRIAVPWVSAERRLPRPVLVVVSMLLATLMGLTIARNRVWADPLRLWTDAVEKAPRTFQAHYGLADVFRERGDYAAAERTYQQAIAVASHLPIGYIGLAESLIESGDHERACEVLRLSIMRVPRDPLARVLLARLEERRDPQTALQLCREALDLNPTLADADACVRRIARE